MKITIIDDDPDIIDVMRAALEGAGHDVTTSPAGANALSIIRRRLPDLVLTDLMMAEVDGLELVREIRGDETLARTTIIMVSSRTDTLWKDRATEAGAQGYIEKPIDAATFARDVEMLAVK